MNSLRNSKSVLKTLLRMAIVSIALIGLTEASRAEIIYEDVFDRTGPIHKTAPAPTNIPSGGWSSNVAIGGGIGQQTQNSSLMLSNISDCCSLPYSFANLDAHTIVTLSAELNVGAGGGGKAWVGIGFVGAGRDLFRTGVAWVRLSSDGKVEMVKGPGYAAAKKVATFTSGNSVPIKITYDTSTNTAMFYIDSQMVGTIAYETAPTVGRVFIATVADPAETLSGSVKNFKLETASAP